MFVALRQKAGEALLVTVEGLGFLLSFAGGAVVAFLGKAMLSVVLFAIALGIYLRLSGRRKVKAVIPPADPPWTRACSALGAGIEVAALVEATNLPVRFDQPGFEIWHWALVVTALLVAYSLNMRVLRALARKGPVPERLQ